MSRLADVSTHAAHVKGEGSVQRKGAVVIFLIHIHISGDTQPVYALSLKSLHLFAGTRTDQSREQGPAASREKVRIE